MKVDYTINPKGITKIIKQRVIANRPTQDVKRSHKNVSNESKRRQKKRHKGQMGQIENN